MQHTQSPHRASHEPFSPSKSSFWHTTVASALPGQDTVSFNKNLTKPFLSHFSSRPGQAANQLWLVPAISFLVVLGTPTAYLALHVFRQDHDSLLSLALYSCKPSLTLPSLICPHRYGCTPWSKSYELSGHQLSVTL